MSTEAKRNKILKITGFTEDILQVKPTDTPPDYGALGAACDAADALYTSQLGSFGTDVISTTLKAQICGYLGAHFAALTVERGGLAEEQVGETRQEYDRKYEMGLGLTRFGQMAISLDPTGTLRPGVLPGADVDKKPALFAVV